MSIVELVEAKTAELTGVALMWAAMTADGWECSNPRRLGFRHDHDLRFDCKNNTERLGFTPGMIESTKLIHKHAVSLEPSDPWAEYGNQWTAMCISSRDDACNSYHHQFGSDPITAGLRAIVGAVSGETVLIPAVLLELS